MIVVMFIMVYLSSGFASGSRMLIDTDMSCCTTPRYIHICMYTMLFDVMLFERILLHMYIIIREVVLGFASGVEG